MLDGLLDGIARRLRIARVVGHTVVLRIRFDDFTRATRSCTLPTPTADTAPLRDAARRLLDHAQPLIEDAWAHAGGGGGGQPQRCRRGAARAAVRRRQRSALDHALDDVRDRFGAASVGRAALLGKDRGWSMPLLPDG